MKNKESIEVSNNQIVEYLTEAATHGGYSWDGVRIENGTAVTCLKTIAGATGLSYYRVKKCIGQLVEAGRITITRHKCFAIITFCSVQPQVEFTQEPQEPQQLQEPQALTPYATVSSVSVTTTSTPVSPVNNMETPAATTPAPMQPPLNRAARRRLAREAAKKAARTRRVRT